MIVASNRARDERTRQPVQARQAVVANEFERWATRTARSGRSLYPAAATTEVDGELVHVLPDVTRYRVGGVHKLDRYVADFVMDGEKQCFVNGWSDRA